MRRLISIFAAALACLSLTAAAAQPGADEQVETLRELLKTEKKQLEHRFALVVDASIATSAPLMK